MFIIFCKGIFKQPLEPTMILRVLTSQHHPCPLWRMLPLGRASQYHQTHLSRKLGEYKTQVHMNIHIHSQISEIYVKIIGASWNMPKNASIQICIYYYFTGTETWPPGVCLKYVGGDQFGHVNIVMVRSLDPQEISDVSVQMRSPVTPGMYQGQWRMCTATGLFYGGEKSVFYPIHLRFNHKHLAV